MTATKALADAFAAVGSRDELRDLREWLLPELTRWDGEAGERVLYDDVPPVAGRLLDALLIAEAVPAAPVGPARDDDEVTGLATLQFHRGGLFDGQPVDDQIHLVRSTRRGTPGPTLCGIDRFMPGPDSPGWSVGGGIVQRDVTYVACSGCVDVARRDFPGLTVGRSSSISTFQRVFGSLPFEAVTSRG